MKIAIASGKGGTGKTTVAVNLAKAFKEKVTLIDCDVEEPNCHLFLKSQPENEETVYTKIPKINDELCNVCGECSSFCEFNALASLGVKILVFPEMCHSCGGCIKICPQKAISEIEKPVGVIKTFQIDNIKLLSGFLDIGIAMATPLIKKLKAKTTQNEITIIDSPPGVSCPVISTLTDVDFVILVTEATPFGLNDLKLAVRLIRQMNIPFGVVINRTTSEKNLISDFCNAEKIDVFADIPEDIQIAKNYSKGNIIIDEMPQYQKKFLDLKEKIKDCLLCRN
ncbi:MAG: P-loop NTPase [Alphaproteobacteria bacterium]